LVSNHACRELTGSGRGPHLSARLSHPPACRPGEAATDEGILRDDLRCTRIPRAGSRVTRSCETDGIGPARHRVLARRLHLPDHVDVSTLAHDFHDPDLFGAGIDGSSVVDAVNQPGATPGNGRGPSPDEIAPNQGQALDARPSRSSTCCKRHPHRTPVRDDRPSAYRSSRSRSWVLELSEPVEAGRSHCRSACSTRCGASASSPSPTMLQTSMRRSSPPCGPTPADHGSAAPSPSRVPEAEPAHANNPLIEASATPRRDLAASEFPLDASGDSVRHRVRSRGEQLGLKPPKTDSRHHTRAHKPSADPVLPSQSATDAPRPVCTEWVLHRHEQRRFRRP